MRCVPTLKASVPETMNDCKYQHYVFNTYKSRSVLIDPDVIKFLYDSFNVIAKTKGFKIIACRILGDHVHCLIKYNSRHKRDYIIRMLKGISARKFFRKFPKTNRFVYRKLWARSYFASEIEADKIYKVINYIKSQIDNSGFDKRYKLMK